MVIYWGEGNIVVLKCVTLSPVHSTIFIIHYTIMSEEEIQTEVATQEEVVAESTEEVVEQTQSEDLASA